MYQRDLRGLVATMQTQVTSATAPAATTAEEKQALLRTWDSIVKELALGPEPATRNCPTCSREIMRDATLCGYCWTKSVTSAPSARA